jgi:hypothetical protein
VVPVYLPRHQHLHPQPHAEYLEILVDKAHAVGLPLARLLFYNDGEQIQRVAGSRAEAGVYAGRP